MPAEFVAKARTWYRVLALSPVKLLSKLPTSEPSLVWLSAVVGPLDVLQHTPRAVTLAPPVAVTFPPPVAVDDVTDETPVVVTVGSVADELKLTSLPYAVPTELVA
ncbi:MAG: hypothetical protein U1A27_10240 [Phycisphaerae bacterium]